MKVRNELLRVSEFRCEEPGGFLVRAFVSGPSDQIKELTTLASAVNLGVEDFGDFVLGFTVDFDGRRRSLDTSGDGVRSGWLELGDMENGVNGAHRVG